jgi:hypothetical protein
MPIAKAGHFRSRWLAQTLGMSIHLLCFKSPKFFILKIEVEFKTYFSIDIYFKESTDDHYSIKKHFWKPSNF